MKTDFQKEIERIVCVELMGLSKDGKQSEIANALIARSSMQAESLRQLISEAEREIQVEVADLFFGDRSLDVFGLGKRFAALLFLALFSTIAGALSFAVQSRFGIRRKQLEKMSETIEDKLILKIAKSAR